MSNITTIQWADSTVNPIMGCGGCELYPNPEKVLTAMAVAINSCGIKENIPVDELRTIYKDMIDRVFTCSKNPHPGHIKAVNVTNIWHLRERFAGVIRARYGDVAATAALNALKQSVTCYAAKLHLNKGANILDREGRVRGTNKGYAPIFEQVTQFPGRCEKAAGMADLLGRYNPETPWKDRLSRLVFVSDMGDAFSSDADMRFLQADVMPAIISAKGLRHIWLWLTKRPYKMARFARMIGGFPPNLCAMTTLTGPDPDSLKRLADIKTVDARMRGLSIEPLWARIPPELLDLSGIDWVIVGGESGSGKELTRPFDLAWARELREHCERHGVAFFLKQLGRNPTRGGKPLSPQLTDSHGGDWDEWPDDVPKVREFPRAFHEYRRDELKIIDKPRP